ncbi:MAG: hypothetical protein F6K24_15185 [Okeania sp. SIO2D1]|nr:hypothetical protein [Okeania sp. SIO2D1]
MGQKKQQPKPPSKEIGTSLDPTVHYKIKVIAAQQSIPLNELTRRILTYYANSCMPTTPMPPLPNVPFTNSGAYPSTGFEFQSASYLDVASNGGRHL